MSNLLRVLLLEDNDDDAALVTRELRRQCATENPNEPLEIIRADSDPTMRDALATGSFELVLSDWSMPGFGAMAALAILKESGLDLPFIIVSGTIGQEAAVDAMRAGAHDYVIKSRLGRLGPAVQREVRDLRDRKSAREAQIKLRESEQRYQKILEASLREKEVLLKEVYHRVKNNLQLVSSLLNLQAGKMSDPTVRAAFRECQSRVKSIALSHEKLCEAKDLAHLELLDYLRSMIQYMSTPHGHVGPAIAVVVTGEPVAVNGDVAIPCGLIANELISNAVKHAYPDGRSGQVSVELSRHDASKVVLKIKDDGIGFPSNLDFRRSGSLGLQLVCVLCDQLSGAVEMTVDHGTCFLVTFDPGTPERPAN